MSIDELEQLVLERADICDRWRQHRRAGGKLSLVDFTARADKRERLANREMPDGAAYYAGLEMERFEK